MNKLLFLIFFTLIVAFNAGSSYAEKIDRVIDGDTVVMMSGEHVRLYGIDAPERKQAYGTESKRMAVELMQGKDATVTKVSTDMYGRTVGVVVVDGVTINRIMVMNGSAWVYQKYCKIQPMCYDLILFEDIARRNKLGLWDGKEQAPWNWRKERKARTIK